MSYFLYEGQKQETVSTGAIEAKTGQEALQKLTALGYSNITLHSDEMTASLNSHLDKLDDNERQARAQLILQYQQAANKSTSRLLSVLDTAKINRFFLLITSGFIIWFTYQGHYLSAAISCLIFLSPFALLFWNLRHVDHYYDLQLAMCFGDWNKALQLIETLRQIKNPELILSLDLDVREAQIKINQGVNIETVIHKLTPWQQILADKPGVYESRIMTLYIAAKNYQQYIKLAHQSHQAAPNDPSKIVDTALAEARFGTTAEAKSLLSNVDVNVLSDVGQKFLIWVQGIIALRDGDLNLAKPLLAKSSVTFKELSSKTPTALSGLALSTAAYCLCLARLGEKEQAKQELSSLLPLFKVCVDQSLIDDLTQELGKDFLIEH